MMHADWRDTAARAKHWRQVSHEKGSNLFRGDWTVPIVCLPIAVRNHLDNIFPNDEWLKDSSLLKRVWDAFPEFRCSDRYWWRKK